MRATYRDRAVVYWGRAWRGKPLHLYLVTDKPSLCNVALIRPGFAGPPSPQGKALSTQYNFVEWYHPKKPSPRGKVAAKQTDEGYLTLLSRWVLR